MLGADTFMFYNNIFIAEFSLICLLSGKRERIFPVC